MRKLQSLLESRETTTFNPKKQRVRCYAHIINICSSHVVAAITSKSKSKSIPSSSETLVDSDDSGDSDDQWDDGKVDASDDDLGPPDISDLNSEEWFEGIERDPLKRARRIVRLLRSSDQRKEEFRKFIRDGNELGFFMSENEDGKHVPVKVEDLQLLRDVKTRWDSVYLMVRRLRQLRPVSYLALDLADWKYAN